MKNRNQVRQNRSAARPSPQVKTPSEKTISQPHVTELLIPSKVAIEADDALSIMEYSGKAAVALAMLNADRIKNHSASDDGWQSMEVACFGEGSLELARMVCTDFLVNFSDTDGGLRTMLKRIRDIHQPVPKVYDNENSQLISSHYKNKSWDFEDAIGALRDCLETQGEALSNRTNHQIAHYTSFLMSEKLDAAFKALWEAQSKVHLAFCAVEAKGHQSTELRRAA